MDNYSFAFFLMRFQFIAPMITSVAVLVLSIIATAISVKQTRVLGLSVIFTGVCSILSAFHNFSFYFMGYETAAKLSSEMNVVILVLSLAGCFCLCFYIHHSYQKKFIYIPLLAIPVVGRVVTVLVTRVVAMMGPKYMDSAEYSSRASLITNSCSLIINSVFLIVLFVVFFSNRKREKYIPHYHVICLINLIWGFINQGFVILYSTIMLLEMKAGFELPAFLHAIERKAYMTIEIFKVLDALIGLVFPIYLLCMVIKARRAAKNELEPVSNG